MEKHLLVTVSEQKSAHYGIRFIERLFSNKSQIKLTLFYTAPKPVIWEGERTFDRVSQGDQQARQYEARGRKALEEAKQELIKAGFNRQQIMTKFQVRQHTKVMDIVQEGEKGLYDAVVLGRRGLTWLQEAFDESVTKDLLEKKYSFPIWLCRRPDPEQKDVLLCVDGSEASYRMADHVGFILGDEKGHEVTLLVIKEKGTNPSETADTILQKSREHLFNNGLPEDRVKTKGVETGSVAKAILKEAEQGRFAVVARGRTGTDKGGLKGFFIGPVTDTLFRELEKAALWICY